VDELNVSLQDGLERLQNMRGTLPVSSAKATVLIEEEAKAILAHIESLKAEIKMLKDANAEWQKDNERLKRRVRKLNYLKVALSNQARRTNRG